MSPIPQRRASSDETVPAGVPSSVIHGFAPGDLLFGRYRYERELGRGGMGMVLLAQDDVLRMRVALKVPPVLVMHDAESLESLKKEVLRGMALTHSGIVRTYSFEHSGELGAIVMEYVNGETMADVKILQPEKCFDCEQVRSWLEQLCPLLDYAHHEAKIAHRDLKPRNILLTVDGHIKVTDFGISSSLSDSLSRVSVRLDRDGTPPYMSPQQAMGDRPTHLDDIYSLGATFYDLLTSRPPFFRGDILAQVLEKTPPSMTERRAELGISGKAPIPEIWERLIAACLAKDPAARPASGKAILEWLRTSPSPAPPLVPSAADSSPSIVRIGSSRTPLTLPKRPPSKPEPASLPVRFRRLPEASQIGRAVSRLTFGVATAVVAGAIVGAIVGAIHTRSAWSARLSQTTATPAPIVHAATPPSAAPMLPPNANPLGDPKLQAAPGVK